MSNPLPALHLASEARDLLNTAATSVINDFRLEGMLTIALADTEAALELLDHEMCQQAEEILTDCSFFDFSETDRTPEAPLRPRSKQQDLFVNANGNSRKKRGR